MPKSLNLFFCKECGYETIKWLGQCPSCKAWNSMVEAPKESKKRPGGAGTMLPLHFQESYEAYQKEHIVRFREPFWKEIDLHSHEGSTADYFFSYYQEKVAEAK